MRQRKSRLSCTNSGQPAIAYDRLRNKVITFAFPRNLAHQGEGLLVLHQLCTNGRAIDEHSNLCIAKPDATYCKVFTLISRFIDAEHRKVLSQCIGQLDIPFLVAPKHIKDCLGFDNLLNGADWHSWAVFGHSKTPCALAHYGTLLDAMIDQPMYTE